VTVKLFARVDHGAAIGKAHLATITPQTLISIGVGDLSHPAKEILQICPGDGTAKIVDFDRVLCTIWTTRIATTTTTTPTIPTTAASATTAATTVCNIKTNTGA